MAFTETDRNGTSLSVDENKTQKSSGVKNGALSAEKSISSGDDDKPRRTFLQRHAFLITIMMATMMDSLGFAVRGQYKYRYVHAMYADELAKYNTTSGCGVEVPPVVQAIENKITAETTQWTLYEMYTGVVPMITCALVVGMRSDQIGRRFIFLFPFFSSFIDCIIVAVVVRMNLHFGFTLIGYFIYSAAGGNVSMAFAGYALISDTHGNKKDGTRSGNNEDTTVEPGDRGKDDAENDLDMSREHSRTFKIVMLDVLRKLSSSAIAFATGYIIQYAGFFYTLIIVMGLRVCTFVFAFVFVTETGEQKKSAGFIAPLRTILRATKNPRKRLSLLLVNLGLLFSIFSLVDEIEVLRTYQMSPPFCFSAVMLGYFDSEYRIKGLLAIPVLWVWRKIHLSESTIAAVGLLFHAAATLLLSTIRQTWVFWAVPLIAIPGDLTVSMAKALTSRLIGRSALASTFAIMLAAEEVFWFAGSNATNYLYKSSLDTVPTAPFYLAFASFVFSSTLFIAQTVHQRRHPDAITAASNMEVNVQEPKSAQESLASTKL